MLNHIIMAQALMFGHCQESFVLLASEYFGNITGAAFGDLRGRHAEFNPSINAVDHIPELSVIGAAFPNLSKNGCCAKPRAVTTSRPCLTLATFFANSAISAGLFLSYAIMLGCRLSNDTNASE